MAITETILGPNSSMFVIAATDTPATIMAAVDTYITSKGWTLHDAAAPGTLTVGRVYKALQQGSSTTYKYVQIGFNTTNYMFKIWESWNEVAHTGTNDGSNINIGTSVYQPNNFAYTLVDGSAFIIFANPRWLAMRTRTNTLVYSNIVGAFEISKDFGEDPSIPTNIFITNHQVGYPSNTNAGYYGSLRGVSNGAVTGVSATAYNNVVTAIGIPNSSFTLNSLTGGSNQNGVLTMTAAEHLANSNTFAISKLRGRIYGLKMVYGTSVWNDMDRAQVLVDSNYHQSTSGNPAVHHLINPIQSQYDRFMIPV